MTEEPKFQAPPMPPKAPAFGGPTPAFKPAAAKEEVKASSDIPSNNFAAALKLSPRIFETKIMAAILGGCVVVGMVLGMVFFGGGSQKQTVIQGLTDIVVNPDIRGRLLRCGRVSVSSPCAVFIMNHSRDDRLAEDFFKDAAKLTGRSDYMIRIENQKYAKARIPPGWMACIKIPPLR